MSDAAVPPVHQVREDFDRIAAVSPGPDTTLYHDFLLRHVPRDCGEALEAGCGRGTFARALAARARQVTAIDLSPVMIAQARARSAGIINLEFVEGDLLATALPPSRYDFIASIATLHHLPFAPTLAALAAALKPGGVLAILDVTSPRGVVDRLLWPVAAGVAVAERVWRTGRILSRPEVRAAWAEHGRRETYLSVSRARSLSGECLPGATVRRHLLWRYSLIWRKP